MVDLSYDEWRNRLFDLLVGTGEAGRPLYLFVDRDDLAEAGEYDDPAEALVGFTTAYRQQAPRVEPFRYEYLLSLSFDPASADQPPYFLALVMSVLAVTEEPLGAAHGVYRRQNALLGREPARQPPPKYTSHVPAMWQAWNRWLDAGGSSFGRRTARSHPHWTHQGWARSQGIFRHQDRLLVQDWFEDRGIEPGDHVPRTRLLREFESWLRFHRREGERLLARINDEAVRDVLGDLLESELAGWTGQVARSLGERRPRGLLLYDEWAGTFSLGLVVTPDLEGQTIELAGQAIALDASSGLVAVPVTTSPATLLEEGEQIRLSDRLVLRGGGETAYVFAESVEAQGLLQERRPLLGYRYTLLVHDDVLARARLALEGAGALEVRTSQGPVAGWSWLHDAVFARPVPPGLEDVFAGASPSPPPQARLAGGLRVAGSTYLTGGTPDVLLPPGSDPYSLQLDGQPYVDDTPDDYVVNLPGSLPPGHHEVTVGSDKLGFRVEPSMHSHPQATRLGHAMDLDEDTPFVFSSSARPLAPGQDGVVGARVLGVAGDRPLLRRVWPGQDVLVLTEQGEVLEVFPDVPRWMREAGLEPLAVDVARVLRGIDDTPAFLLARSPRTDVIDVVEIPSGFRPAPGRVPVRRRPDLVASVMGQWRARGSVDAGRRSRVLSAALGAAQRDPRVGALPRLRVPTHVESLAVETSAHDGLLDVMLRWLSELENGVTSSERFRDTWAWLTTTRREGDPGAWRFALYQLQTLGHVEVDYGRSRVGVAPPVANVLTRGRGFAVLCGARPERLFQILTTGDSGDTAVDRAAPHWDVHLRVQRDTDGSQRGPVATYLEWDPDHHDEVVSALQTIGVSIGYSTSDVLLDLLPGLRKRLALGQQFVVPPAHVGEVKRHHQDDWRPTRDFSRRGLFRFTTRLGPVFAWCDEDGGPLVEVDRRLGPYLLLQDAAYTSRRERPLLHRDADRSTLLVSREAALTPLLARALVLRTGLLPRPVDGPRNALGYQYLEYQNVEQSAADRVAQLLRQPLGYI